MANSVSVTYCDGTDVRKPESFVRSEVLVGTVAAMVTLSFVVSGVSVMFDPAANSKVSVFASA